MENRVLALMLGAIFFWFPKPNGLFTATLPHYFYPKKKQIVLRII